MNTAKKINNLLSSGAVSMTGPTQTRIVKQSPQQQQHKQHTNTVQYVQQQPKRCYVCDDVVGHNNGHILTDAYTTSTNSKVPNKIGRVVGDAFMVIISVDDVVCKRCMSMFNHMDRLENDLERVRTNILTFINKKYNIQTDEKLATTTTATTAAATSSPQQQQQQQQLQQPPHKMQRMNTGHQLSGGGGARKTSNGADVDDDLTVTRKITTTSRQVVVGNDAHDLQQQQQHLQQQRQGTTITPIHNTPGAKKPGQTTKIYKCMSCDFKTVDLKQFQPHYETCKQQNAGFRCKLCKKLFTNMNALKVHTAEKHPNATLTTTNANQQQQQQHQHIATGTEFICSICNINYVNEPSLRKHMETNHPDIKTIESAGTTTTTTTTSATAAAAGGLPTAVVAGQPGALYACTQCYYKTNEKSAYDEHQRKHNAKVRPFKCRLCAQRFETREQASVHAKTHQPDYFKCGKCSMSFPQRELLMKHFETHKATAAAAAASGQQQQLAKQQQQQQTAAAAAAAAAQQQDLTTQKLLQDTIEEALRDTGEADSKIHFFSCNICSLTFIQENYYNQHMETHKRDAKKPHAQQQQVTYEKINSFHRFVNAKNEYVFLIQIGIFCIPIRGSL